MPEILEEQHEKSRSQRKRESTALQRQGELLTRLPRPVLDGLGLPKSLMQAVCDYKGMSTHEARRRQMQFIGRMMREIKDIEGVAERLADLQADGQAATEALHGLERLRERLLANDAKALDELMARYPDLDVQHVRQLVRNANREREQEKPLKSYRALFRYLRDLQESGV